MVYKLSFSKLNYSPMCRFLVVPLNNIRIIDHDIRTKTTALDMIW